MRKRAVQTAEPDAKEKRPPTWQKRLGGGEKETPHGLSRAG